jgi:23S rRNA (uridine2552-2'-O)-methyltransferase
MAYVRKDRYYKKAKQEGFASRAAYKLQQMDKKFSLLRPGLRILDLGAAPGSWLQVISEKIGARGQACGIDLKPLTISLRPNTTFHQGNLENYDLTSLLESWGQKADLVVSDMAPHTSGVKFGDSFASYELAQLALNTCQAALKEGGHFVVKLFPGQEMEDFHREMRKAFSKVKTYIPDATRKTSSEVYLVGLGFK